MMLVVHVTPSHSGYVVHDDRRQLYLHADGRWRVTPWYFESAAAATQALLAQNRQYAPAVR